MPKQEPADSTDPRRKLFDFMWPVKTVEQRLMRVETMLFLLLFKALSEIHVVNNALAYAANAVSGAQIVAHVAGPE